MSVNYARMVTGNKIKQIFNNFPPRKFQKHETVQCAGSINTALHLVESGFIRSYLIDLDGCALTVNILSPGAIFPLTQYMAGIRENPYEFQALSPTVVRSAPAQVVMDYLNQNPESLIPITRQFASGIEGLTKRLHYLMKANGHKRVLSAVDLLINKFGSKNSDGSIKIKFLHTHQDIADIAGVTRETTTRELQILKKAGVLYNYKRKTIIRHPEKFKKLLKLAENS